MIGLDRRHRWAAPIDSVRGFYYDLVCARCGRRAPGQLRSNLTRRDHMAMLAEQIRASSPLLRALLSRSRVSVSGGSALIQIPS